jgi:hypothetical protein
VHVSRFSNLQSFRDLIEADDRLLRELVARVAKPDDARMQDMLVTAMRLDPSPAVRAAIADAIRVDASGLLWG